MNASSHEITHCGSRWIQRGAGLLALAVLAGCAGTPVSEQKMALARSAIEAAHATGASQAAGGELASADAKMARAQTAADNGDGETANRLAEAARVDARLAVAKSNAARAERAEQELQASLDALRSELDRVTPAPGTTGSGAPAEPMTPDMGPGRTNETMNTPGGTL